MRAVVAALAAALFTSACVVGASTEQAGEPRFPVSSDYPPGAMERVAFTAGVPEHWRISALRTPERPEASWKIVIVTGTPSWSEYWAPTIAALPPSREMIVADRPGFRDSEPRGAVRDLVQQADALAPMLEARPGQRVLVVGQSFGAPVAVLMAQRHPDRVDALVLVSAFFGERGPTASRLFGIGRVVRPLLPRDLRNSIAEVGAQERQLPMAYEALRALRTPVLFVHGDADTFVPYAADQRLAAAYGRPIVAIPGGDHFLNACCAPALVASFEQAIADSEARTAPIPAAQSATAARE
jgi:pimeloyl-ACP methyl ester carboxylesterase